jgi:hypothetical protein
MPVHVILLEQKDEGWWSDSGGRLPAYQEWDPDFKFKDCQ